MMSSFEAVGLRASWLHGWLAAVGVTVLIDGARLSWTAGAAAAAVLDIPGGDAPARAIGEGLPSVIQLRDLSIAGLSRDVTLSAYRAAAQRARDARSDFSLAVSVTDLARDDKDKLPHSPFDPPAPRGETLWRRLEKCRAALGEGEALAQRVRLSLEGRGSRLPMNGLGFDYTRITAAANPSDPWVDPVVECLAFYGLALFPVRGDGSSVRARGWTGRRFAWPTWSAPLDRWAIDALLAGAFREKSTTWRTRRLGIEQVFRSAAYDHASSDAKRGYASRRVDGA